MKKEEENLENEWEKWLEVFSDPYPEEILLSEQFKAVWQKGYRKGREDALKELLDTRREI